MNRKLDSEIALIEATQGKLRESIKEARRLAEQVDSLLQTHKATLRDQGEQAALTR